MSRIFSLIFIFFYCFSYPAFALDSDVYTIINIPVSVSDKSPALARNMAVKTAHRNAFLTLLNRLELDLKIANVINDEELSNMVVSQHIGDETISGNNYSANFNISFGRDFIDHILAQKNLSTKLSQKASEEFYLLVPVKVSGKKILLWEENNDWRSAIEKTLLNNSKDRLILAYNDIENIAAINRSNIFNLNYSVLEPTLSRYKAKGIYLLFLSSNELENKAQVEISYIAQMQGKQMKLSFVNVKNVDYTSLIATIARKTIEYISDLKPENPDKYGETKLVFETNISNLGDWLTAKHKIENSGLINQLDIQSISRDKVVFKVNYSGSNPDVIRSFAEKNINLMQAGDNIYLVKIN